jgi:hypothetical protein
MSIEFKCLMCNERLSLPDELAGRKEKCPQCGAAVTVPAPIGGRLTAKRLPVTGTVVAAAEPQIKPAIPGAATVPRSVASSAPRRGRIIGSDRVAAAIAGLNRVLAEWVLAGRRPHPPRTLWWIFALAGFLLPTLLVAIVLVVSAFQNGIRPPSMILFVLFVVGLPLVGGLVSGALGWMIDARWLASYQSLESAAQTLGLHYLGECLFRARNAAWYGLLPIIHNEPDAGDAPLRSVVVAGGSVEGTEVFIVRFRQFYDSAVVRRDSPIAEALKVMHRRHTLQARWFTAIVVCGGPAETPDLLIIPKDDIERHYNEQELPSLQHVHSHPLTAHWVASSHHDWAQQACRNLPPRIQHDKQLALQLLSGNLVLWRGTWKMLGPDAKSAGDWIADVRLAIELRRLLTALEGARGKATPA